MAGQSGEHNKVGLLQVTKSVFAAFFGVQSSKNRERDFVQGKPIHYAIIGLAATFIFVFSVWLIVKAVMSAAGVS